jgi:photosynthetic reaction center cytochrome c subunit
MKPISRISTLALVLSLGAIVAGCNEDNSRITSTQQGRRGLGLVQSQYTSTIVAKKEENELPAAINEVVKTGKPASESKNYENLQVLGDLDVAELPRLMQAITAWVSPEQGCTYCHNGANLASDDLYTKRVARRMIQMTRAINVNWTKHVVQTGVTCYTCHRGQPVPQYIWYSGPSADAHGYLGYSPWAKNHPGYLVGKSALPNDPFTTLLDHDNQIRVVSTTALPTSITNGTIKQTDLTYALMISMAQGLGVNCDFCHNTRAFYDWNQSSPQRVTAWYGIRMVRYLNESWLEPLAALLPAQRLGPSGDPPKLYCATCHQGVNKPLLGQSMLKTWPELAVLGPQNVTTYSDKGGAPN